MRGTALGPRLSRSGRGRRPAPQHYCCLGQGAGCAAKKYRPEAMSASPCALAAITRNGKIGRN